MEVWSFVSFDHTLIIHGRFIKYDEDFYLFNVYAPLTVRLQLLRGRKVCVCGEFNAIRCREERRSVSDGFLSSDYAYFNSFIGDNILVDLPLGVVILLGSRLMASQ